MPNFTAKKLDLGITIDSFNQANAIQQLKTVGTASRPGGITSPNRISATNAPIIAQPFHVQNVVARVSPANDSTSKVTVSFQTHAGDQFFQQAAVYVSNYKGNPQPAQVASGQSPVTFSLENTGEPVAVHVQAQGSVGNAPLHTAPVATLRLRSTNLATVSTPGGNGPPPPVITPGVNLSSYLWLLQSGSSLVQNPPTGYTADLAHGYVALALTTNAACLFIPTKTGTNTGLINVALNSISTVTSGAFGLALWNAVSNKTILFFGQGGSLHVQRYSGGITTLNSSPLTLASFNYGVGSLQITMDGVNVNCFLSIDDIHFSQVYTETLATWIGTPTHYGFIYGSSSNASGSLYEVAITQVNTN